MQYFVMMCSINAPYISSALDWYMGTVIKELVTLSIIHNIYLCPLFDLGMNLRSMLNLDNGL